MLHVMFFGVDFFMLLKVLGSLEGLFADLRKTLRERGIKLGRCCTYFTDVRFERGVDWKRKKYEYKKKKVKRSEERRRTTEMAGYVIALCAGGAAVLPLAGETEIVCALAADVVIAQVVVEGLRVRVTVAAVDPEAPVYGGVEFRVWGRCWRR